MADIDLMQMLQQYSPQRRQPTFGDRMKGAATGFLSSLAGVDPYKQQQDDTLTKLLMTEQIKQKIQQQDPLYAMKQEREELELANLRDPFRKMREFEEQERIKSQFQEQDPYRKAQIEKAQFDIGQAKADSERQRSMDELLRGALQAPQPINAQDGMAQPIPTAPAPRMRIKGISASGQPSFELLPTEEERKAELGRKVQEQIALKSAEFQTPEAIMEREAKGQAVKDSAQDLLDTIQKVKGGSQYFGALGPIPTINPWGFERKGWEAEVQKLLSGKIVNLMGEMKAQSRTGATGFGQLNRGELKLLQEASTALNRGLSPQQALGYLTTMEEKLKKVTSGGPQQIPQTQQPQDDYEAYLQAIGQ